MGALEAVALWYWLSGCGVFVYVLLLDMEEGLLPDIREWPAYLVAFAFMPLIWPGAVFYVMYFSGEIS